MRLRQFIRHYIASWEDHLAFDSQFVTVTAIQMYKKLQKSWIVLKSGLYYL